MSYPITIPETGEPLVIGSAAPTQLRHVTVGPATTNDIVLSEISTATLFDVDEPVLLLHMWTQVEEGFGASATLDIGDTGSAGRFTSDTTIVPNTTGAILVADTGLAVPYVFSVLDNGITIALGGASASAGILHVYLEYALLRD
jgi:hypothetical protein